VDYFELKLDVDQSLVVVEGPGSLGWSWRWTNLAMMA